MARGWSFLKSLNVPCVMLPSICKYLEGKYFAGSSRRNTPSALSLVFVVARIACCWAFVAMISCCEVLAAFTKHSKHDAHGELS